MKKHYLFGILFLFHNFIFSQNFERPDKWFLGLNYTEKISGASLKPNTEKYNFDLEVWLRKSNEIDTQNRELWLRAGANDNLEPIEKILLPEDFYSSSTKFNRMLEKAKTNQLEAKKILLQGYLLQKYRFDTSIIQFDKSGNLNSISFLKNLGENIRAEQTQKDLAILKKALEKVYGEPTKMSIQNIFFYSWKDFHSDVLFIVDFDKENVSVIYSIK